MADPAGLPEHRVFALRQTAELHDVGKMAIPDAVLDKPGPLTEDEWQLIGEHTIFGERIVSAAPALRAVAKLAAQRTSGSTFVETLIAVLRGVAGKELPADGTNGIAPSSSGTPRGRNAQA